MKKMRVPSPTIWGSAGGTFEQAISDTMPTIAFRADHHHACVRFTCALPNVGMVRTVNGRPFVDNRGVTRRCVAGQLDIGATAAMPR